MYGIAKGGEISEGIFNLVPHPIWRERVKISCRRLLWMFPYNKAKIHCRPVIDGPIS